MSIILSNRDIDAVIFDLDGVVTKTAIISSSKNCKDILESVNLLDHFDA